MTRCLLSFAALVMFSNSVAFAQSTSATTPANTLTAAEKKAGWELLFDGTSLAAWRGYQQAELPPEWKAAFEGRITR